MWLTWFLNFQLAKEAMCYYRYRQPALRGACSRLYLGCILRYFTGKVTVPLLTNTSYQLPCLQDTSVFTPPIVITGTALEWRCTAIITQVHSKLPACGDYLQSLSSIRLCRTILQEKNGSLRTSCSFGVTCSSNKNNNNSNNFFLHGLVRGVRYEQLSLHSSMLLVRQGQKSRG